MTTNFRRLPLQGHGIAACAVALACAAVLALHPYRAAHAQATQPAASPPIAWVLPAQPLAQALNALSRQSGVAIGGDASLLAGRTAPAVQGTMTLQQALDQVLAGSGLMAVGRDGAAIAIQRAPAPGRSSTLQPVIVTATQEQANGPVAGYVARRTTTATKTDTPLIETPQSVSVVTAEFAQAVGATRLEQALGYTPGVAISTYGSDSRYERLNVRGFDLTAPGFYLDGLQMRNANSFGVWQTENYGLERIEVLRGPSSVLYGQGSAGGMLNLVSKRPTAESVREIQLSVGNDARKQVAGDVSGALDADGKFLYRVTGLARDAQVHLAGLPDDRFYLAPALTWKPSADTSLTVLSHYLRSRSGTTWQGYPIAGTLTPNPNGQVPLSTFLGEPNLNHFNQDQWMIGYQFEHRFDEQWTLRQNARYGKMDQSYLDIQSFGGFQTVNPGNPADPANFRRRARGFNHNKEDARTFGIDNQAEMRWAAGDWRHTVLFGLDHQSTRYGTQAFGGGAVAPIDVYAPVYGGPTTFPSKLLSSAAIDLDQTGLYAQDQVKFADRWVATVGGRYDSATADRTNRLTGTGRKHSDNKFSGRAGLVYLHPSGVAPYVSYAESFSPSTTVNPATGDLFSPETGQQLEAGLRWQPPGSRSSYTVSVYNLKRQNYITYDFSTVPAQPRQTGEITVKGLEVEALVQPMRGMNLVAGYSYTPKADVTRSSNPGDVGKQSMPVSRNQLSVWTDYKFDSGFKIGVGVRYVGANNGVLELSPVPVPSYTLADAMLGYDIERWSLALNVRNLSNKTYIGLCDPGHCYYGEPRKVTATATYRW